MDRELLARISRRWVVQGGVGAFLAGGSSLLSDTLGEAHKRRKKKKKKRNKHCRGRCTGAEVCNRGDCICPDGARYLPKCAPSPYDDVPGCIPDGNPAVCCPPELIYAVCPVEAKTADGYCGAPEAEAPSVCCPATQVCGKRCCEDLNACENASESRCTFDPPLYARMKRP